MARHPFQLCLAVAAALVALPAPALELTSLSAERMVLVRAGRQRGEIPGVLRLDVDRQAYHRLRRRDRAVIQAFPLPDGGTVDLELRSFTPLARDARLVVVDEHGSHEAPAPDVRFFRGRVAGDAGGLVTLSLYEDRLAGFIRAFGEEYGVGPEEDHLKVWNRGAEPAPARLPCAGERLAEDAGPPVLAVAPAIDGTTPLRAQVAIDATVEWYNRFGSVPAAQTYILNLMAEVSTIYESEVGVQLQVPYLRIFAAEPDPYGGAGDVTSLLGQLTTTWNASQSGVARTVVHLFHRSSSGGAGVAYVDELCGNDRTPGNSHDYGVSAVPGNGATWEKDLVAHELGHNFASAHTHCYSPEIDRCANQTGCYSGPVVASVGTIMSYCNQKTSVFGPRVVDVIRAAAEEAYPLCMSIIGETPIAIDRIHDRVTTSPAAPPRGGRRRGPR